MTASIPAWVPFLFIGLSLVGYRQSLPRVVRPTALAAIALAMFGFSLYGVASAFGSDTLSLLAWAMGYFAAASLGARTIATRGLVADGDEVRMPGSWMPMVLILGIFAAKFVLGAVTAMHSPLLQQTAFIAVMSTLLGALSGGFGARALAVHRCATATAIA